MKKNKFVNSPIKFTVVCTELRNFTNGEFIAQLNEADLKKYNLKAGLSEVVIAHKLRGDKHRFKTVVTVHKYPEKTEENNQLILEQGHIAIDQTIRDAIGCFAKNVLNEQSENSHQDENDYTVEVFLSESKKSKFSSFIKMVSRKISNAIYINQYNIARVLKATPNDMEINISRISFETMQSIGIEDGDKIKVKSVTYEKEKYAIKEISIRALMMDLNTKQERESRLCLKDKKDVLNDSEKEFSRRKEKINENGYDKFIRLMILKENIEKLPMIFLDNDARTKLGVDIGDTVIIFRSFRFTILNNIMKITIPLLLVFLGVGINLKDFFDFNNELLATIIYFVLCTIILIIFNLLPILRKFK